MRLRHRSLFVVDDEFKTTSLIIGQNFTELSLIIVLKDSAHLTFHKSPNCNPFNIKNNPIKLFVTNTTQILHTKTLLVYTKNVNFSGDVFIEGYCGI